MLNFLGSGYRHLLKPLPLASNHRHNCSCFVLVGLATKVDALQSQDYESSSRTQAQAHQKPRQGMQTDIDTVCMSGGSGVGGIVGCKQHRLNKVLGEDFFSVVPNTSVSLVNAFLSHVFFFFSFAICSSTSLSPVRMKLPSTYALSLISGRAFSTGHNRAIVGGPLSSVNALVLLIWGVC